MLEIIITEATFFCLGFFYEHWAIQEKSQIEGLKIWNFQGY